MTGTVRIGVRDFKNVRRVVIKIGSSSLTYSSGKLNLTQIELLVRQMADLHNQGKEVILVTSGAVGAGMGKLGLGKRPRTIPEKQAVAAVGQGVLLHMYEKFFLEYGVTVAQVLLTRGDFADRRRFLNARNALEKLLQMKVIPVINENDTVSVDELKLGDNDSLSALVAALVDADLLVILSDIEGLYDQDPRNSPRAKLLHEVFDVTGELEAAAGGAGSDVGTGGMVTKLQAAKVAGETGVPVVIARAAEKNVLCRVIKGEVLGTVFWPRGCRLEYKKRWIAFANTVAGKIFIDNGAKNALIKHGKSLLPSGITAVEGCFDIGNTVSIIDAGGVEIGRGLVNFNSSEVRKIMGKRTTEIEKILGHKDYDEVVHRNNLVLLGSTCW
ncbi:glutamate 5-kinase [Desulfohalotomaculum tongense]|uniref:glutamate 5-kinase n=1 Tax=Desulforadius tongensis TaxID=1216062 RepID=UPI001956B7B1|nr:glutamate 5-kinase [Desulforadius tongensis]MBM7854513.1 glutamate 5-kinase [Desulforadius tongensis]